MKIHPISRVALSVVLLVLIQGCATGDDDDSSVDPGPSTPSFDNSGVWPEVDCSEVNYYWSGDRHYAVRITPPETPWQLTGVSVSLIKPPNSQSCAGGPVEVVAVVTPDPLPSVAMIPLLEDAPTALVTLAELNWDALEDGVHVLEETLDEPLLVEQEGDLYLVVSTEPGGGMMNCLPNCAATSDNHTFMRDDGGWEVLTEGPGESSGITATIEY